MKIIIPIIFLAMFCTHSVYGQNDEDNDFAEFDDFDSDDEFETISEHSVKNDKHSNVGGANDKNDNFQDVYEENDDDDGVVEEESEFEHFRDDEEFEGFTKNDQAAPVETGEPKLTMVISCQRLSVCRSTVSILSDFTGKSAATFPNTLGFVLDGNINASWISRIFCQLFYWKE